MQTKTEILAQRERMQRVADYATAALAIVTAFGMAIRLWGVA